MSQGAGCALCGRAAVSRRIDLTDSDVNARDVYDYEVRGVLRGVLICPACVAEKPIGQLLGVRGGVELVRGCMVQCADEPPWWLRRALPGGARAWRKTVCPCCGGKANIQVIADIAEHPPNAWWEGLRAAFRLLDPRRPIEEDDYDADEGAGAAGGPGAGREGDGVAGADFGRDMGGLLVGGGAAHVALGDAADRSERADGGADAAEEVPGVEEMS